VPASRKQKCIKSQEIIFAQSRASSVEKLTARKLLLWSRKDGARMSNFHSVLIEVLNTAHMRVPFFSSQCQ
jgi:hypothetical protein